MKYLFIFLFLSIIVSAGDAVKEKQNADAIVSDFPTVGNAFKYVTNVQAGQTNISAIFIGVSLENYLEIIKLIKDLDNRVKVLEGK